MEVRYVLRTQIMNPQLKPSLVGLEAMEPMAMASQLMAAMVEPLHGL
jgi:hypothetical protein